ncbi:MAG: hypothetical protein AAF211_31695, partial [Myxococcota bacterium]
QIDGIGELLERWSSELPPGSAVLVTSRTPLAVSGEVLVEVGPLTQPESAALLERRFAERGVFVDPDEPDVRHLAALLELPLAVELAASWVDVLPLPRLRERLSDILARPDGPATRARYRSLHAAFEGSLVLLDPADRPSLCQAAAFPSTFDLAAAEEVLEAPDILGALRALRRSALLQIDAGRYRMLPTLRSWAATLDPDGYTAARVRHLQWVLRDPSASGHDLQHAHQTALQTHHPAIFELATRIHDSSLSAPVKARCLAETLVENASAHPRLVLAWATALRAMGHAERARDVLARHGRRDDAEHLLLRLECQLEMGPDGDVDGLLEQIRERTRDGSPTLRARTALAHVSVLRHRSDPHAADALRDAIGLAEASGDAFLVARGRMELALVLSEQSDQERAEPLLAQVVATYEVDQASARLALALLRQAKVWGELGNWDHCRTLVERSVDVARRAGAAHIELQAASLGVTMAVEGGTADATTAARIDRALARLKHLDAPNVAFNYRLFHAWLPVEEGDYPLAMTRLRWFERELRGPPPSRTLWPLLLRLGQVELAARPASRNPAASST